MKIAIGFPHLYESGNDISIDCMVDLRVRMKLDGYEVVRISTYRENVTFARNKIATKALENGADYLLFLDDDMVFPADLFERLVRHKKDIVAGLTFLRRPPHQPSMFQLNRDGRSYDPVILWKKGELVECDGVGMACTLIDCEVLKKMTETVDLYRAIFGFFDNHYHQGEDLRFCRKARDLGFKVFCDTSLIVGHSIVKEIRYGDYKALVEEKIRGIRKEMAEAEYVKPD